MALIRDACFSLPVALVDQFELWHDMLWFIDENAVMNSPLLLDN
jgi:hypothetical protein